MSLSRGEANRRFDEFRKHFDLLTAERLAQSGLDPFEGRGARLVEAMRKQNRITKASDKRLARGKGISEATKRRSQKRLFAKAEADQRRHALAVKKARARGVEDPYRNPDLPAGILVQMIDNWREYDIAMGEAA